MVDADVFEAMVDGIVDGMSKNGFDFGDGLEYDEGCDDESDGEYAVRAFYYDSDTELQHTLVIRVSVEVASVVSEEDEDDDDE